MGKIAYRPDKGQLTKDNGGQEEHLASNSTIGQPNKPPKSQHKVTVHNKERSNTTKFNNVKQIGDINCNYHIYVEDYVYTYIYQLASVDLAKESSAILIGEIYSDTKEVIVKGVIAVNMDKLSGDVEWIDLVAVDEADKLRKAYFEGQDIIGWMHMQPGYGTMLTMKELKEHQSVFEGIGTICMLVDAINKIESVYVYEEGELKEQSGYLMYYERNDSMQQYMLDYPFNTSIKEEVKDNVVNQFREIGKMRKEQYKERKNLNLAVVTASLILIGIAAASVKLNDQRKLQEQNQGVTAFAQSDADMNSVIDNKELGKEFNDPLEFQAETSNDVGSIESKINPVSPNLELDEPKSTEVDDDKIDGVIEENNQEVDEFTEEDDQNVDEVAQKEDEVEEDIEEDVEYDTYTVKAGDTLANICYDRYGDARKSLEVSKINKLKATDEIYVGQVLKMPEK